MNTLNITMIDVAWGDSIFIESIDSGNSVYALIDSNDTTSYKSSLIFLKKFFERKGIDIVNKKPLFDFVLLSHAHSDHGQGLKEIMMKFGTKNFYYPKSLQWAALSTLISFANSSPDVLHHESVNSGKNLNPLGNVSLDILWPDDVDPDPNENNNSVVLTIQLGNTVAVLTGDAEKDVWSKILNRLPSEVKVFKVPHHGSINGTFDNNNNPCWLNNIPQETLLGISSHIKPFGHPHEKVVKLFENRGYKYFRTDSEYHLTFRIDAAGVNTKYSHF
jgi:competence protein ComEC